MSTTLKQIKKDLTTYKALVKRQEGVTLYADKYVLDLEFLLDLLEPKEATKEDAPKEEAPEATQPKQGQKVKRDKSKSQ